MQKLLESCVTECESPGEVTVIAVYIVKSSIPLYPFPFVASCVVLLGVSHYFDTPSAAGGLFQWQAS